ncbi:MAG: type II toxin-antitoxin system CcdA family antitoxin [Saprospiraceae bacterium]|nr:type II toxin-antitoxin system CcdA family antitoxin [Saprospiraceae bacterium]
MSKNKAPDQAINFSLKAEVINQANALKLDISNVVEDSLKQAIVRAKEEEWLKLNRRSIKAYNERIERIGLYLNPLIKRKR